MRNFNAAKVRSDVTSANHPYFCMETSRCTLTAYCFYWHAPLGTRDSADARRHGAIYVPISLARDALSSPLTSHCSATRTGPVHHALAHLACAHMAECMCR